jgi:gliding motility associated protien GldN
MRITHRLALLPLLFLTILCTCVRAQTFVTPVNDIVSGRESIQPIALKPAPLRAADIMWQKRTWRVIDVREKINHTFTYPPRPLVNILLDAATDQKIQLYSPIDDKFSTPLTELDRQSIAGMPDTVPVYDGDGEFLGNEVIARDFDPATVTRYRVQEVWYFNKKTSQQDVRILGIAPIVDETDEMGNVIYERVLFWAYYPGARKALAEEMAYTVGNDAGNRSWTDIFDSRFFNSYIMKESNIHDRRIEDYLPAGRDRLLNSQAIEAEILSKELDVWSN